MRKTTTGAALMTKGGRQQWVAGETPMDEKETTTDGDKITPDRDKMTTDRANMT